MFLFFCDEEVIKPSGDINYNDGNSLLFIMNKLHGGSCLTNIAGNNFAGKLFIHSFIIFDDVKKQNILKTKLLLFLLNVVVLNL